MNRRSIWIWAIIAMTGVPAWADCGVCGSGSKAKKDGHGDKHGHSHSHGHAHADAAIGQPAPDFTLTDLSGKKHSLADLKGNVVVLEWTNHTCPFVKRHQGAQKTMQKTFAKFEGKPVKWLAIDSSHFCKDKVKGIKAWAKANDIASPILLDPTGQVGHRYGAKTTPHMFVIDLNGVLAYSGAIDDDPYGDKQAKRNYVEEAVKSRLNGSTLESAKTKPYGCTVKYK